MEVLDNVSAAGFLCHRCGSVLEHDADRHSIGHQKSTRMNNQFKFITDLLPQIDMTVVPDNNFEEAYRNARPVQRSETHQAVQSVAVETGLNRPTAVKGLANTGPQNIQVNISTAEGMTEEEKAAVRERKAKLAQQNALPSWMLQSTVTGESFVAKGDPTVPGIVLPEEEKDPRLTKKLSLDAKEAADMEDYFAKLKAEQAAEAACKAAEEEEEYESGDEDEGDFEDVVGTSTANSAIGTPASTGAAAGTLPVVPSPLRQSSVQPSSSLKREAPDSGTSTEATSPTGGATPDERAAKKPKLEEAAPAPTLDDDEEDELEFEDV